MLLAFTLVASYASAAVLHFGLGTGFGKRAPGDVITHCTVPGTVALTFVSRTKQSVYHPLVLN